MGARHRIKYLDAETREQIDRFLAERQRTVDEFYEFLTDNLDVEISRSSSHRYMQGFESAAQKMRQSRQVAAAFAQEIGEDNIQGRQGRVLVEMFQTLVQDMMMQRLQKGSEAPEQAPLDTKSFMELARAIRDTMTASKLDVDRESKIREEAQRDAAEKALAICQKMAKEQGATIDRAAALAAIREQLGIKR